MSKIYNLTLLEPFSPAISLTAVFFGVRDFVHSLMFSKKPLGPSEYICVYSELNLHISGHYCMLWTLHTRIKVAF